MLRMPPVVAIIKYVDTHKCARCLTVVAKSKYIETNKCGERLTVLPEVSILILINLADSLYLLQ